jgi:G3E family GTPase
LDTLVTVVDAVNFAEQFGSLDNLAERGWGLSEEDDRDIVQLLVDQIEFANVLIISKCDLVADEQVASLTAMLRALNPSAKILRSEFGQVPLTEILHTSLFSPEWAQTHQQWLAIPRGAETSETEEYGFGSLVFQARVPFHPARLHELVVGDGFDGVVRSKGIVWLATRPERAGEWSQAGRIFSLHPSGFWAAATSEEDWPTDEWFRTELAEVWQEPFGDRRIELILIGQDLERAQLREKLQSCLLTPEELAAGPAVWEVWSDPFPAWEDESDVDEEQEPEFEGEEEP